MKKYLDKGYKQLDKDIDFYTEQELQEIIGDVVTDSSGFAKHMLAKQADKVKDSSIEKVKTWAVSRKIDGRLMPSQNSANSGNPEMGILS